MRYRVLENGQPIVDLAFLPDLDSAKRHGEKLAADKSNVEVRIDGNPEKPGPMLALRFDREVNAWVGTTGS